MVVNGPVLMPVWMVIVTVVGILLVLAWLLRSFLVTRRDLAHEVGDIPMASSERSQWVRKVEAAAARFRDGGTDLRGLHLELAEVVRGFATARSGEDLTSATVREILDMASDDGPEGIEDRIERARSRRRPLSGNPLAHVGELLAVWEQPSFDRDPQAAAEEAVEEAREVVARW